MAALSKWVPIGTAPDPPVNKKLIKPTTIDKIGGILCHVCNVTFENKKVYDSHYMGHGLGGGAIIYTCVVCLKEIDSYPSFRGHCYLQHVTKDKFKCEYCDKVFSKPSVLNTHIATVHQHKCLTCNKEFKGQKELAMHQVTHKNNQGPPYTCITCGQQIDSSDDCEQHIEDHCNMTYSCPICKETIPNIQNATNHLTKHFGNVLTEPIDEDEPAEIKNDSSIDLLGGIFCKICDQIYKARPEFDNHFVVEHLDEPIMYGCNICGKEFDKYCLFASHCYDHYAKDRFQCEVCFKCFPRLSLLVTHVAMYHREESNSESPEFPFTCYECDHGFKTQRRLKDHRREVHNLAIHQCLDKACKKIFSTPKELSNHLKEHASSDLSCRTCGLRFNSASTCERHIPVHRKKDYRCPVCDKAYGEKYLVMKHVNQHFSSVLHVCNICGKVYNARFRLNHHMKGHMVEKDHKCSYCGKGFTKIYLLKQHINIHMGLRPYTCTACSKSFASYPNLTKHMKCMHNITKVDLKEVFNPNRVTKIPNQKPNTKIEKIPNAFDDYEKISNEESNDTLNNNAVSDESNTNLNVESSELFYGAPSFSDSDESGWRADSMDTSVLEMLEENMASMDAVDAGANDITELENALWLQSPTIPTASPLSFLSVEPACVPREYGPEFVNAPVAPDAPDAPDAPGAPGEYVQLDDHLLPHIDPLLTINAGPQPHRPAIYYPPPRILDKWEPPIFTKVYPEYQYSDLPDARYSVMNTDIF